MYYRLNSSQHIYGQVLLDQTIALDLNARKVTQKDIVDKVSIQELTDIIERYLLLFSIDK